MGVSPDYLPGQQPITNRAVRRIFTAAWHKPLPQGHGKNAVTITEGMKTGETEGIVIIGSDAIGKTLNGNLQAPLFSVVIAPLSEEALPDADVILPGATFAETEGTFTNCERRIQRLHRAVPPPGGKENWEIIAELATALGYPMHYPSVSSIFDEMASLVPLLDAIKYDEMGEEGRQWPYHERGSAVLYGDGFSFEDGLARLRHAELEHVEVVAEAVRNLARASHPV
jgi:predicted molibdopterin-dependent oxidoreductase YjgC